MQNRIESNQKEYAKSALNDEFMDQQGEFLMKHLKMLSARYKLDMKSFCRLKASKLKKKIEKEVHKKLNIKSPQSIK